MSNLIGIFIPQKTTEHHLLDSETYLFIETNSTPSIEILQEQLSQVNTLVVSVCSGGLGLLTQLMDADFDLDCKIILVDFGKSMQPINKKERVLIQPLRTNMIPDNIKEWDKHLLNISSNIFARSYDGIKSKYRSEIHPPQKGMFRRLTNGFRKMAAVFVW